MKSITSLLNIRPLKFRVIFITAFLITLMVGSCQEDPVILPVLNTIQVQDAGITSGSARLKGEITSLGNQKILEYGIELYKNSITNSVGKKFYTTPAEVGTYEVEFTGLEPGTLYFYRAYVLINTAEVYSQNSLQFTTKPASGK